MAVADAPARCRAPACFAPCPRSTSVVWVASATPLERSDSSGRRVRRLSGFEKSLPAGDPKTSAFQLAVRRASGGGLLRAVRSRREAVACRRRCHPYSHVTAPLRRLADRYVIEAALALANGDRVSEETEQAFVDLPQAMRQGDSRANRVDRAAIDLAEAIVLQGPPGARRRGLRCRHHRRRRPRRPDPSLRPSDRHTGGRSPR